MSFFQKIGSIVENVKEFYSEINAATLTGAIDVIVVEQEDGSLVSSPFHVRFGKLGVLKAKEKIVDLEVNGIPVEIQMKLDDTGAAFFVEPVEENEEECSPELATSPIPDQPAFHQWRKDRRTSSAPVFKPRKLQYPGGEQDPLMASSFSADRQNLVPEEDGKRIVKKKRRTKKKGHGRQGSKSSLQEVLSDNMFPMDDVNDAEGETESESELVLDIIDKSKEGLVSRTLSFPLPSSHLSNPLPGPKLGSSAPPSRAKLMRTDSDTPCLLGARIPLMPKSSSEAEALEALLLSDRRHDKLRPQSVSAGFHYFSEDDSNQVCSMIVRPPSPGVLSDSELEVTRREEEDPQNVWRWGELPYTTPSPHPPIKEESKTGGVSDRGKEMVRERSWFGGWRKSEVKEEVKDGCYLDDLINDPEKLAYYLKPMDRNTTDTKADNTALENLVDPLGNPQTPLDPLEDKQNPTCQLETPQNSLNTLKTPQNSADTPETSDETSASLEPLRDPLDLSDVPLAIMGPEREDDCESGHGPSLPMSPHSLMGTTGNGLDQYPLSEGEGEEDLPSLAAKYLPDLAASLCGGLKTGSVTLNSFEEHAITYSQFMERLRGGTPLLEDPALVIRLHEKYLSWNKAAPILLSVLLYRQPLPQELVSEIVKDGVNVNLNLSAEEVGGEQRNSKKSSTWFGWWATSPGSNPKDADISIVKDEIKLEPEVKESQIPTQKGTDFSGQTEPNKGETIKEDEFMVSEDGSITPRRCKKTLRLSSEKLAELNLRAGSNEVEFSVTTAFQGTTVCRCHIYLWHHSNKVVISDIDGTITKSDVLGHILPVIGRDWAQSGVAQLFSKIRGNGYHIMYLSARAIGQASMTKDYLESLRQGEVCLPDGPVFLNPDSLIHALKREVIDKNPEEFKIRCLKDIQTLYEGSNPFFAGYGNKPNDAYAYRAVGIPVSRIFTINPSGELKQELTPNFQTSYPEQNGMVDQVFPPVGKDGFDPDFRIQDFSSFGFWKEIVAEVDLEELAEFAPDEAKKKGT